MPNHISGIGSWPRNICGLELFLGPKYFWWPKLVPKFRCPNWVPKGAPESVTKIGAPNFSNLCPKSVPQIFRRINSSLPQWKSPQKTVQDTMVKSPKIEIFENFENPHPGKSCFSWKFQCFLMKWSFVQQIRCIKPIFDTDFSSRIDW